MAHKKVNTNDLLQLRRPYKALSSDICKLCMKHGSKLSFLTLFFDDEVVAQIISDS